MKLIHACLWVISFPFYNIFYITLHNLQNIISCDILDTWRNRYLTYLLLIFCGDNHYIWTIFPSSKLRIWTFFLSAKSVFIQFLVLSSIFSFYWVLCVFSFICVCRTFTSMLELYVPPHWTVWKCERQRLYLQFVILNTLFRAEHIHGIYEYSL